MKTKGKRSEFDADVVREYRSRRDAEDFLRSAQGYLAHAIKNVIGEDQKAVHHSMARVKECLSEASRSLRSRKLG